MRILMTTDTIGGVWTFTRELVSQLLPGGHSVALVSFGRHPSPEQLAWASQMEADYFGTFSYTPSSAPLEWMDDNEFAYEEGASVLHQIAQDFDPDIFHSNQFCFGSMPLDVPTIVTAHSDVLSWAEACRPFGLERSSWLARYNTLVQDGLDVSDFVITPTHWMLSALQHNFNVECRTRVIHNGRTLTAASRKLTRELRAISVGRLWDEAKGLHSLLQIHPAMPVAIAGEDKFEAAAAPAPSGVQSLGHLPEIDLLDAFRSSSIYIATSIYEPFGLAPLEAALCGCAVVARDLPSFREIWGDAALYFSDNSTLEHLLAYLAETPALLRSCQLASQHRAFQFPAQAMAQQYMYCYQDLLHTARFSPHARAEESAQHAA
jgi:glycosyltransferase involved in cell wall biosynthesis